KECRSESDQLVVMVRWFERPVRNIDVCLGRRDNPSKLSADASEESRHRFKRQRRHRHDALKRLIGKPGRCRNALKTLEWRASRGRNPAMRHDPAARIQRDTARARGTVSHLTIWRRF